MVLVVVLVWFLRVCVIVEVLMVSVELVLLLLMMLCMCWRIVVRLLGLVFWMYLVMLVVEVILVIFGYFFVVNRRMGMFVCFCWMVLMSGILLGRMSELFMM